MSRQVKKAREAGTVDPLTLKGKDTGLPFKVRAFMRLDRSGKVSALATLPTKHPLYTFYALKYARYMFCPPSHQTPQ